MRVIAVRETKNAVTRSVLGWGSVLERASAPVEVQTTGAKLKGAETAGITWVALPRAVLDVEDALAKAVYANKIPSAAT